MTLLRCLNLGKSYPMYRKPSDRLWEWLTLGRLCRHEERWVLRGVTLRLERGEVLGLVGGPGAGKTTLLRILAGALRPSAGRAETTGRTIALIDQDAWWDLSLPAAANLQRAATLLSLPRRELGPELLERILAFFELRATWNIPLEAWPRSVRRRLALSLAFCLEPDLLLLDDAFRNAEPHFRNKALEWLRARQPRGLSALLTSSDPDGDGLLPVLTRAAWLDDGEIRDTGDPPSVLGAYRREEIEKDKSSLHGMPPARSPAEQGEERRAPRLTSVRLLQDGRLIERAASGTPIEVRVELEDPLEKADVSLGLRWIRDDGVLCFGTSTRMDGSRPDALGQGRFRYRCRFEALNLLPGVYTLGVTLGDGLAIEVHDERNPACHLTVLPSRPSEEGIAHLEHSWQPESEPASPQTANSDPATLQGVQLETSGHCPLQCTMCYRQNYEDEPQEGHLSRELLEALRPQLRGLEHADLGGWGEPLAHPDLPDVIRAFRDADVPYIIFATNGLLLSDEMAERLIESGLTDLNISLDAARDRTHAQLRPGSDLQKLLPRVRRLRELRERHGSDTPRIQASFVMMRSNIEEFPEFVDLMADHGVDEVVARNCIAFKPEELPELLYEGFYDNQVDVDLRDRMLREAKQRGRARGIPILFIGPLTITHSFGECFCRATTTPFVNWNGEVSPCCFLGYPVNRLKCDLTVVNHGVVTFGNLRDAPLEQLWNSPGYVSFRHRHEAGDEPLCEDCPALYLFSRHHREVPVE